MFAFILAFDNLTYATPFHSTIYGRPTAWSLIILEGNAVKNKLTNCGFKGFKLKNNGEAVW